MRRPIQYGLLLFTFFLVLVGFRNAGKVAPVTYTAMKDKYLNFFSRDVKSKMCDNWPRIDEKDCSRKEFMNKGINSPNLMNCSTFPRTGLVSFPGSGNTWTRYLIEQGTGLWTGSVFNDKKLYNGGFLGELEKSTNNSVVVVKAHYPKQLKQFERVILIIRNPVDAIFSEFNRIKTRSHTGLANQTLFAGDDWMKFVVRMSRQWLNINLKTISTFIDHNKTMKDVENPFTKPANFWHNLLLVSYERLKRNPVKETERITKFLKLSAFRKHCLETNHDGSFHRNSSSKLSLSCIYKNAKIQAQLEESKKLFLDESRKLGAGNIYSEIEDINTDECSG